MAQCFITLENGLRLNNVFTCGDNVRAKVHLHPRNDDSLSISDLVVNFKCKVRTLITTGSGDNRRTHKSKVYLFWFAKRITGHQSITINHQQSWDVEFDFPWSVPPDSNRLNFKPDPSFPHTAGHPLPPTWSSVIRNHTQSIEYYLEAVMTRHGHMIDHTDKNRQPLLFSPPPVIPSPAPNLKAGPAMPIERTSRLLDPANTPDNFSIRERTKHFFSSHEDPFARFSVHAEAPTTCCVGDTLPVNLRFKYNESASTAPEQPVVTLSEIHIRITEVVRYRVASNGLFGGSQIVRDNEDKLEVARKVPHPRTALYDGLSVNEFADLRTPVRVVPSFGTFTINCTYMLKISAIFSCAGKDFDITLIQRRPLDVLPARAIVGPSPAIDQGQVPVLEPQGETSADATDKAPPAYSPAPAQGQASLPSYEESDSKKDRPPPIEKGVSQT